MRGFEKVTKNDENPSRKSDFMVETKGTRNG